MRHDVRGAVQKAILALRARRRFSSTTTCRSKGVRADCEISLVLPFGTPFLHRPTITGLLEAFEQGIGFIAGRRVRGRSTPRRECRGSRRRHGCRSLRKFLGVPKWAREQSSLEGRMAEDRYVPVDGDARDPIPHVYAFWRRVATVGASRADLPQEGRSARVNRHGHSITWQNAGRRNACRPRQSRRLLSSGVRRWSRRPRRRGLPRDQKPTGFQAPSSSSSPRKQQFGASRRARWFPQLRPSFARSDVTTATVMASAYPDSATSAVHTSERGRRMMRCGSVSNDAH
mgnify:CR=1 FL=1